MSKYSEGFRYYLLVIGVGLLAAAIAVLLQSLYSVLWGFTQDVIDYSILLFVPLAFVSIGLPYVLVKLFADTKTTGSGTHTVLHAYHLTNGEIGLKDTIVKPTAAILTIGLGGSAGPEGPSLLSGGVLRLRCLGFLRFKLVHEKDCLLLELRLVWRRLLGLRLLRYFLR